MRQRAGGCVPFENKGQGRLSGRHMLATAGGCLRQDRVYPERTGSLCRAHTQTCLCLSSLSPFGTSSLLPVWPPPHCFLFARDQTDGTSEGKSVPGHSSEERYCWRHPTGDSFLPRLSGFDLPGIESNKLGLDKLVKEKVGSDEHEALRQGRACDPPLLLSSRLEDSLDPHPPAPASSCREGGLSSPHGYSTCMPVTEKLGDDRSRRHVCCRVPDAWTDLAMRQHVCLHKEETVEGRDETHRQ